MFCRKCGQVLTDDSVFCNKCGCAVELLTDINAAESSEEDRTSPDFSEENEEISKVNYHPTVIKPFLKIKRAGWIAIAIGAVIILLIGYNVYFQKSYNEAKGLYSDEKYYEAGSKIENLIYFGGDSEFDRIKFALKIGTNYEWYNSSMEKDNPSLTPDYNEALGFLMDGLESCKTFESYANSDVQKDELQEFRSKYYSELSSTFNLSEDDANKIMSLDYEDQKSKIESIASELTQKESEQANNCQNPVEFKDLSWDNNSLYTIATGSVYNKSDETIHFVTLKVAFKDKNGNVIDTASTYAVGEEGLAPGESKKWSASVDRDPNIDSYTVSLTDFQ